MLRILLQYLLPLLLPFLIWLAYAHLAGRPIQGPWLGLGLGLAAAGVCLMAVSLVTWSLLSGADPSEHYVPARIEDGRVVPGTTEP